MNWWMKLLNFLRIRQYTKTELYTHLLCGGRQLIVEHYVCKKTKKSKYRFVVIEIDIGNKEKAYLNKLCFAKIDPEKMKILIAKQKIQVTKGENYVGRSN